MDKVTVYYTDSYNGKSSRALLRNSASLLTGIDESEFIVAGEKGQKPRFLSHPNVHFSISHSGNFWAAAFATEEVGLDIQIKAHGRDSVKLAQRFFSPAESDRVKKADFSNEEFTRIWSRKEAVVKLLGSGIDENFKVFDSLRNPVCVLGRSVTVSDFFLSEDLAAAIAYSGDFEIEIKKI